MKAAKLCLVLLTSHFALSAQKVEVVEHKTEKKVDVWINEKRFTSFLFPDTIEKPFLYPILTASEIDVTRGFPLNPKPNDPTDHPHHIGIWFNYESVNGLDFWNNSYA